MAPGVGPDAGLRANRVYRCPSGNNVRLKPPRRLAVRRGFCASYRLDGMATLLASRFEPDYELGLFAHRDCPAGDSSSRKRARSNNGLPDTALSFEKPHEFGELVAELIVFAETLVYQRRNAVIRAFIEAGVRVSPLQDGNP